MKYPNNTANISEKQMDYFLPLGPGGNTEQIEAKHQGSH